MRLTLSGNLIAISKPCQGSHSYRATQVQSKTGPSFILTDFFSQSDKRSFWNANDRGHMNVALVPAVTYVPAGF